LGAYFVTICTHERTPLFGRFLRSDLVHNQFSTAVEEEWRRSADLREEVETDAFIGMPNRVHGIVWIQRGPIVLPEPTVRARRASPLRPVIRPAGTASRSLGAVVGSFKSAAARRINLLRNTPGAPVRQRNYHDRIIRDERELNAARQYIIDNPRKWSQDKHNPTVFPAQP
jgi:REP element-mobilizing transposase RayT